MPVSFPSQNYQKDGSRYPSRDLVGTLDVGASMEGLYWLKENLRKTTGLCQSYGFSSSHVWMWELDHKEGWVLWCWRRPLRVPWTARRSNQSILKEINTEYSLKGLMLKFQYFGHLMWRANSLEKILVLGKIEGRRRRGWQRRWDSGNGNTDSVGMSLGRLWQKVKDRKAWCAVVHGVAKSRTWLIDS